MRTRVDLRLIEESARFALRFACEDCAHFDAGRERACGLGWPERVGREALAQASPTEEEREPSISFCKEFELGG